MSKFDYEKINSRVIRGESEYLAKADSAETLRSIFSNEETRYEVSVSDVKYRQRLELIHELCSLHIAWKMQMAEHIS